MEKEEVGGNKLFKIDVAGDGSSEKDSALIEIKED